MRALEQLKGNFNYNFESRAGLTSSLQHVTIIQELVGGGARAFSPFSPINLTEQRASRHSYFISATMMVSLWDPWIPAPRPQTAALVSHMRHHELPQFSLMARFVSIGRRRPMGSVHRRRARFRSTAEHLTPTRARPAPPAARRLPANARWHRVSIGEYSNVARPVV